MSAPDAVLAGRARAEEAFVLGRIGRPAEGAEAADEAVELLRGSGDRSTLAAALRTLAALRRVSGRATRGLLEEAQAIHRELDDPRGEALTLGALAIGRMDDGDLVGARADLDQAIALLRRSGAAHLAAVTLANRAFVDRIDGQHADAERAYEEALSVLRARGDTVHECLVLGNLGEIASESGRLGEACRLLKEAVRLASKVGFAKLEGLFLTSLGLARMRQGHPDDAHELLQRGEDILAAGGFPDALCGARAARARAAIVAGDLVSGAHHIERARSVSPGIPWVDGLWERAKRELDAARTA